MGISLSPSVVVQEIDLSNIVPAVATSIGALVGNFRWGPALDIITISSENKLVETFGKPDDANAKDWFTAANFLQYSNDLRIVRAIDSATALNSTVDVDATSGLEVASVGEYVPNVADWTANGSSSAFTARYPGVFGDNLSVVITDSTNFGTHTFTLRSSGVNSTENTKDYFDVASLPSDEYAVIVLLNDGLTNDSDTIVETWIVNANIGEKNQDNEVYFIDEWLGKYSKYIYSDVVKLTGATTPYDFSTIDALSFGAGAEGTLDSADYQTALDIFTSEVDINLLMTGGADATVAKYALQNVAEVRKDCVAFLSPSAQQVDADAEVTLKVTTNTIPSSSYGFYDSNYKYQYDRYNDKYRWIPFNGDIAGLCARTDYTNDPWWSPAGFNRGNIKGVVKLAYETSKADRDNLYKNNINPIVNFSGEGTVLYGDKTLQSKASAFDRINVRRLFIVLEKAISTASRYILFEFNDFQTRQLFVNMVEPYLRRVKGKRGIYDYKVHCDETNNTPEVIDNNEFVGDIYIQPAKSINTVVLSFIATRTGIDFEEVIAARNPQ